MAIDPTSELSQFRDFVSGCLDRGERITPESALDLWRLEHPSTDEAETVQAVMESLADLEAGDRGIPVREFLRDFRRRHGLSEQ